MWVGCDVEPVLGLEVGVLGQEAQEQCLRLWGQHRWSDSNKKEKKKKENRLGFNPVTVSLLRFSEPVLKFLKKRSFDFIILMPYVSRFKSNVMYDVAYFKTENTCIHQRLRASARLAYAGIYW